MKLLLTNIQENKKLVEKIKFLHTNIEGNKKLI